MSGVAGSYTYMALVVQLIVGELELVEADHLSHPGVPRGERVWVDVDPRRNGRVGVPRHHPLGAVVHVPAQRTHEAWVERIMGRTMFLVYGFFKII